jgi:hypothetical protein
MLNSVLVKLTTAYLSARQRLDTDHDDGFEIAQSMGIALLGLVVAAAFATALQGLGVDVIARIRSELGL